MVFVMTPWSLSMIFGVELCVCFLLGGDVELGSQALFCAASAASSSSSHVLGLFFFIRVIYVHRIMCMLLSVCKVRQPGPAALSESDGMSCCLALVFYLCYIHMPMLDPTGAVGAAARLVRRRASARPARRGVEEHRCTPTSGTYAHFLVFFCFRRLYFVVVGSFLCILS